MVSWPGPNFDWIAGDPAEFISGCRHLILNWPHSIYIPLRKIWHAVQLGKIMSNTTWATSARSKQSNSEKSRVNDQGTYIEIKWKGKREREGQTAEEKNWIDKSWRQLFFWYIYKSPLFFFFKLTVQTGFSTSKKQITSTQKKIK